MYGIKNVGAMKIMSNRFPRKTRLLCLFFVTRAPPHYNTEQFSVRVRAGNRSHVDVNGLRQQIKANCVSGRIKKVSSDVVYG